MVFMAIEKKPEILDDDPNGKIAEQARILAVQLSELSHVNEGETGFNPTPAEMAVVFEGIKAAIEARRPKK